MFNFKEVESAVKEQEENRILVKKMKNQFTVVRTAKFRFRAWIYL